MPFRCALGIFLWSVFAASAYAEAHCPTNNPIFTTRNGLIVGGALTPIKGIAYSVPKNSGSDIVDLPLVQRDFVEIRRAGFNVIRGYEPFSPRIVREAESAGLYVVQALVHLSDETNFDSDDELSEVIERVRQIVTRDRCKSGVLMWSLWNDAPFNWGSSGGDVVERFSEPVVHRFLTRLRDEVKSLDIGRPVTAANVLNAKHPEIGMDLLDVIGINAYIGIFDWPSQRYSPSYAKKAVRELRRLSTKYARPIWISETGVSSISGADPLGAVLPSQLLLIKQAGLAGFAIFQWRDDHAKARDGMPVAADVEANWGLLTTKGLKKPGFDEVVSAVKAETHQSFRLSVPLRETWSLVPEIDQDFSKTQVIDQLSFDSVDSVRSAYKVRSKGMSHAYLSPSVLNGVGSFGLKIHYVPEDFGAWFVFGRVLEAPVPISVDDSLLVDIGEHVGGRVNFSVMLRLSNGRVVSSPPLNLQEGGARFYKTRLDSFLGGMDSVKGKDVFVEEVILKLNDVANFEQPKVPVQITLRALRLVADI